jgi:hypothetical protein
MYGAGGGGRGGQRQKRRDRKGSSPIPHGKHSADSWSVPILARVPEVHSPSLPVEIGSRTHLRLQKSKDAQVPFKWMELENISLSKVSQAQKTKNRMFSLICGL